MAAPGNENNKARENPERLELAVARQLINTVPRLFVPFAFTPPRVVSARVLVGAHPTLQCVIEGRGEPKQERHKQAAAQLRGEDSEHFEPKIGLDRGRHEAYAARLVPVVPQVLRDVGSCTRRLMLGRDRHHGVVGFHQAWDTLPAGSCGRAGHGGAPQRIAYVAIVLCKRRLHFLRSVVRAS